MTKNDIILILGQGTSQKSFACCRICLSRLEFFAELFVVRRQEITFEDVDPSKWPVFYESFVLHRINLHGGLITVDTGISMMPFFTKFCLDHEVIDRVLASHMSDDVLDHALWEWNAPEAGKLEAISSIVYVLSKCNGWEGSLSLSFQRGVAALEKALKHSYNKFTVQNFIDLAPLMSEVFVPSYIGGNPIFDYDLTFLEKFVGGYLGQVGEDVDVSIVSDDSFPNLLHTAIRLSFAVKQRDRANREKNEAIRERDAAVQEKEAILGDIRAAIGRYN